jgi:hypothetical protein
MGARVSRLVDRIREEKGPFFVARVCLRVNCRIDDKAPDTPEAERAIVDACRELGYDLAVVEFGASSGR